MSRWSIELTREIYELRVTCLKTNENARIVRIHSFNKKGCVKLFKETSRTQLVRDLCGSCAVMKKFAKSRKFFHAQPLQPCRPDIYSTCPNQASNRYLIENFRSTSLGHFSTFFTRFPSTGSCEIKAGAADCSVLLPSKFQC